MSTSTIPGKPFTAVGPKDCLTALPLELLFMICEHLLPSERSFTDKSDLLTVYQLSSRVSATARELLFRDITITFILKEVLPRNLSIGSRRSGRRRKSSSCSAALQSSRTIFKACDCESVPFL